MTKLLRRFMLCRQGVTAIEYALIASLIAIVIVTGATRPRHGRSPAELKLHPYRERLSVTARAFLMAFSPPAIAQPERRRPSPSRATTSPHKRSLRRLIRTQRAPSAKPNMPPCTPP